MRDLKWEGWGHLGGSYRDFIAETIFHKPDGISLQRANKLLVTFAFSRHPFERLVSAYYNHFQGRYPNISVFARYAIKMILDRLKVGRRPNDHLIPQYATCPYCQLDFDLVGKLENMEEDTAFLARHLNLTVKSEI